MLQSRLLMDTVQLHPDDAVLFLNSAADPFVAIVAQQLLIGSITLAEDNVAALASAIQSLAPIPVRSIPFHEYISSQPAATMSVAIMNILYAPSNTWMQYGIEVAAYALKQGGKLYMVGAKDRGILTMAKRMRARFGNVETLAIRKGNRVVCSTVGPQCIAPVAPVPDTAPSQDLLSAIFAQGELDEGTQLLLDALEVRSTDVALDIGCGAGFLGLSIARSAPKGSVTMVDVSRAAVAQAQQAIEKSGLNNIQVLPSDGAQAVLSQRFDLVVTNPPFHRGGIQTTEIAERFIREAAQVLRSQGRFYLVANRFLKYEPTMRGCFKMVEEVGGNTRYKVLLAQK